MVDDDERAGPVSTTPRRRWEWWHRQTTTTRRVVRTSLALVLTGLLSALLGTLTASADSSLGPHAAHYSVTAQHEVVLDLGPLGAVLIDSPLPWPLGVDVVVQEIPVELSEIPANPVSGLAGDLSAYAQVFSDPGAVVADATLALVRDALGRTVLIWSGLLVLIAVGRFSSRGLLRRGVAHAARRPGVVPLVAVVALSLVVVPTAGVLRERTQEGTTIRALAGTPMAELRMTGRMAQLIDTYGGYLVDAFEANEDFYAQVNTNLEAAYAQDRSPRRPPGIPLVSPAPVDPEAHDPDLVPTAPDAADTAAGGGEGPVEGAADGGRPAEGAADGEGPAEGAADDGGPAEGAADTDGPGSGGTPQDAADDADATADLGPAGTVLEEALLDTDTGATPGAQDAADARGAPTEAPARVEPVTLLLVSDLHCNVGMASVIATALRLSGAQVLLDAGDTVMSGTSVESYCVNAFARAVPDDVPMIVATGNHDSVITAGQMDDAGYTVLDGSVVEVEGIRILGDADPTLTAVGEGTKPERDETIPAMEQRLAADACAEDRVDLLLVHNPRAALQTLTEGCVPLAVSGHWHRRQGPEVHEAGVRYISGSTAGASGGATVGPLNGPAEMTVLRIDATSGQPLDYRVITIGTDTSVDVGRWYRFPEPPAAAMSGDTGPGPTTAPDDEAGPSSPGMSSPGTENE